MTTALVIDDNSEMADSLCKMLGFHGLQPVPAYGARWAILTLSEKSPDIIFLDLSMPGLSGYEVLAYIRREPRLADTPVVVVTSNDQPETSERALQAGAARVMIKPVTLEALETLLSQLHLI